MSTPSYAPIRAQIRAALDTTDEDAMVTDVALMLLAISNDKTAAYLQMGLPSDTLCTLMHHAEELFSAEIAAITAVSRELGARLSAQGLPLPLVTHAINARQASELLRLPALAVQWLLNTPVRN